MIGHYQSPLGWIQYETKNSHLIKLSFIDKPQEIHQLNDQVFEDLNAYFHGNKKSFDIDVEFEKGTDFQLKVWHALLEIPYGETVSYQTIAERISNPKAFRAVGQACKKNPIGIIVPCHRVIGKDNEMKGYSGKDYIDLKVALLKHENASIDVHI